MRNSLALPQMESDTDIVLDYFFFEIQNEEVYLATGEGAHRSGGHRSIEAQFNEATHRSGRKALNAEWAHQLELAATEVHEEQAPPEESLVVFYKNFTVEGQMGAYLDELQQQVGKGVVHRPPASLRDAWLSKFNGISGVTADAPDGVSALKAAGVDAVEDVAVVSLTRAEALVGCHAQRNSDKGYCHSPPTSSKMWATRTKTSDGAVVPLLWTCHTYAADSSWAHHAPCHVNERTFVALTPAHAGLLSATEAP